MLSPPPPALIPDHPSAADPARARLSPKSRFSRLFLKHKPPARLNLSSQDNTYLEFNVDTANTLDLAEIELDASRLYDNDYGDRSKARYEWAVLYENQRGMTIFSVPYYSSKSLLPRDPYPFTIPSASLKRSDQPDITLSNYPLPDGNWRWVSRSWMIDMRSGSGEVQHDGFEYNWMFRQHHWRPQVGPLSAGGWVRRRRWVRLMMCPPKERLFRDNLIFPSKTTLNIDEELSNRHSVISSLKTTTSGSDYLLNIRPENVWADGDVELDWLRCRILMRSMARDGKRLEVWQAWLGHYLPEHVHPFAMIDQKGKRKEKQWTEDDSLMISDLAPVENTPNYATNPPPRERVVAVLRTHGHDILQSFLFPDSRVQFLKILGLVGLLPELGVGLGIGIGATEIDFWSYAREEPGMGDSIHQSPATDTGPA